MTWWEEALTTGAVVALIAFAEVVTFFHDVAEGFLGYAWKSIGFWSLVAFVGGCAAFAVVYGGQVAGSVQVGGHDPNPFTLIGAAVVLAQGAVRAEAPRKPLIQGSPSVPGDRESWYTKFIRMVRTDVYRNVLRGMHQDPRRQAQLPALLMRGLPKVFTYEEAFEEFETWANTRTGTKRDELLRWGMETKRSKPPRLTTSVRTLFLRMCRDDVAHACSLAGVRADSIIDQRALR